MYMKTRSQCDQQPLSVIHVVQSNYGDDHNILAAYPYLISLVKAAKPDLQSRGVMVEISSKMISVTKFHTLEQLECYYTGE